MIKLKLCVCLQFLQILSMMKVLEINVLGVKMTIVSIALFIHYSLANPHTESSLERGKLCRFLSL